MKKSKGRLFQKEIAEAIARHFGWTIEALSSRSVGKVVRGVRYVSESDAPDLRVRQMGQSGPDILPLSSRAKMRFPFLVEAKSRKRLPAMWSLLVSGDPASFLHVWMEQARKHCAFDSGTLYYPLVAFRANRTTPFVCALISLSDAVWLGWRGVVMLDASSFGSERLRMVVLSLPEFLSLISIEDEASSIIFCFRQ